MYNPAAGFLAIAGIGTVLTIAALSSADEPKTATKTVSLDPGLPSTLATQVVSALATSKDPKELTGMADELAAKGFPMAAAALRTRAAELPAPAPGVVPAPAQPSSTAPPTSLPPLDPGIDDATAHQVLVALTTETDAARLTGFAHQIEDRYPLAATALLNKAASLLAQETASDTVTATDAGILPWQTTAAAPAPASPPAAAGQPPVVPPATLTREATNIPSGNGTWKLANDADVAKDAVAPRYAALLNSAIGTSVVESHNGRTWEFKVVGKKTDPTLTTYDKDVKGWIWQPGALGTIGAPPPPVLSPIITSHTLANVPPNARVRDFQHRLNLCGAQPPLVEDGIQGPKTTAAVKTFQASVGLVPDGIVGPKTEAALDGQLVHVVPSTTVAPAAAHPTASPMPTAANANIRSVQQMLNALGASPKLAVDGLNGPKTQASVRAFQAAHGLPPTGTADTATQNAMLRASAAAAQAPAVQQVQATRMLAAPAPGASASMDLRGVQHALNLLGQSPPLVEDGINGPKTSAAVRAFQSTHGLAIDGNAGPKTKSVLVAALNVHAPPMAAPAAVPAVAHAALPQAALARSQPTSTLTTLATLRDVQHALNLLGQRPPLAEDGVNGPKTSAAVRTFQAAHGLAIDGDAGPKTKSVLLAALSSHPSAMTAGAAPSGRADVAALQHTLNQLARFRNAMFPGGIIPLVTLREDGIYGPKTAAVVASVQRAYMLPPTGSVDDETQAVILAAWNYASVDNGRAVA